MVSLNINPGALGRQQIERVSKSTRISGYQMPPSSYLMIRCTQRQSPSPLCPILSLKVQEISRRTFCTVSAAVVSRLNSSLFPTISFHLARCSVALSSKRGSFLNGVSSMSPGSRLTIAVVVVVWMNDDDA
jgi:hypothetical protein